MNTSDDDSLGNRMPPSDGNQRETGPAKVLPATPTIFAADSAGAWGGDETQFFFALTPDRVLDCLEQCGLRPTGRVNALNSFENRVYEVEFEKDDDLPFPQSHLHYRKVLKFYRPGRWSEAQILEEHQFLKDLVRAEIPVIAPEEVTPGKTLARTPEGIFFTIFPKRGGRSPDELDEEQCLRVGRLVARIHQVGRQRKPEHRLRLDADTYARAPLEYLLSNHLIPADFRDVYAEKVNAIAALADRYLDPATYQRVHGDCHFNNLLWGSEGAYFLDFDDFCSAPPIQDLWLMQASRDDKNLMIMIEGYEEILSFDRRSLKWIEILRALRIVHYTGWIARRFADPAFPKAFPHFGTSQYWKEEVEDLEKQWQLIRECMSS